MIDKKASVCSGQTNRRRHAAKRPKRGAQRREIQEQRGGRFGEIIRRRRESYDEKGDMRAAEKGAGRAAKSRLTIV